MRLICLVAVAALFGGALTACGESSECNPYEQFRLNGLLYFGPSEDIARDQLGEEVGEITQPLPSGAVRCEPFTLSDGQGTPTPGSKVYAINGTDRTVALAVIDSGTESPRLYRVRPSAP